MSLTLTTKKGDTRAWLFDLTDANGAAVDVSTGVNGIVLHATPQNNTTGPKKIDGGSCTAPGSPVNRVRYPPVANDVDTAGALNVEVIVTWTDTTTSTFPTGRQENGRTVDQFFVVHITDDLGD